MDNQKRAGKDGRKSNSRMKIVKADGTLVALLDTEAWVEDVVFNRARRQGSRVIQVSPVDGMIYRPAPGVWIKELGIKVRCLCIKGERSIHCVPLQTERPVPEKSDATDARGRKPDKKAQGRRRRGKGERKGGEPSKKATTSAETDTSQPSEAEVLLETLKEVGSTLDRTPKRPEKAEAEASPGSETEALSGLERFKQRFPDQGKNWAGRT
ncbi:MAG: hypothetical protein U9Q03_03880 [Patescibacteria group bacterium]|nr:hypothetical protein [Patescibacteria group bacterium]